MLFLEEKKKNTVRVGLSGVAELTADYCWTPSRAVGYSELAVLLNNGPCRKIPESRCSNAHLCIHEELIGPSPTLFIQPLQVLVFYTPCRKSSACSSSHLACHSNFTVFSLILSISDFSQLSSVRAFLWFFFWRLEPPFFKDCAEHLVLSKFTEQTESDSSRFDYVSKQKCRAEKTLYELRSNCFVEIIYILL